MILPYRIYISTDLFKEKCDLVRSWYNDGLVMQDAATTTSAAAETYEFWKLFLATSRHTAIRKLTQQPLFRCSVAAIRLVQRLLEMHTFLRVI